MRISFTKLTMYDFSGGRADKDKGCVLAGVLTCLCSPVAQLATLDALSPNVSFKSSTSLFRITTVHPFSEGECVASLVRRWVRLCSDAECASALPTLALCLALLLRRNAAFLPFPLRTTPGGREETKERGRRLGATSAMTLAREESLPGQTQGEQSCVVPALCSKTDV